MNAKHVYEIVFEEQNIDIYSVSKFLDKFEKLCMEHNVKVDHIDVKLLERRP